jgi:Putative adhesin
MPAYEFDRATPVTVALRMHRGVADVTAEDRPGIQVEVLPLDDSTAARDAAGGYQVTLEGDSLIIHAPEGFGWPLRRTPKIHVVARVPAGSSLAAQMASADLRARGDYGIVQAELSSGDGYVERAAGDAELKSASGDLQIDRVGGSLRVGSASGDLRVGDVSGDVSVSTASGDLSLHSVGGSIQGKTASGDIQIGRLIRGQATVNSASGDVTIGVARGTGVWLDVNTASGDTKSDLTMNDEAPPPDQQATLELRVRTASGDIHIHRAFGDVERETV